MNAAVIVASALALAGLVWLARRWLSRIRLPQRSAVVGLNQWSRLQMSEFTKPVDMSATKRELEAMEEAEKADLQASTAFRKRLLNAGRNPSEHQQHGSAEAATSEDPDEQELLRMTAARQRR